MPEAVIGAGDKLALLELQQEKVTEQVHYKELQVPLECTNSSEESKDPDTCRMTRDLLPRCKLESTSGSETMPTLDPHSWRVWAEAQQELMWS